MKKFNDLKINSKFTKRNKLQEVLFSELPKKTKFKLGVYSEGMFFYYGTYKNTSFELGFFFNKDRGEMFPTEIIEELLSSVDYKKFFSLQSFYKKIDGKGKTFLKEYKF